MWARTPGARVGLTIGLTLALASALAPVPGRAQGPDTVQLEALTTVELAERIAGGTTTLIVPIGGTEQNGAHMTLGKHNTRVRVLAERIARTLGRTVVAPVIAYVPEGPVAPPAAHMRFVGTLTIPSATFQSLLESAARSAGQHGFRDVVLIGDHGGYQKDLVQVAERMNRERAAGRATGTRPGRDVRVHALTEYYRVTQTEYLAELRRRGFSDAQIGTHAGLADTALALAADPADVRRDLLAKSDGAAHHAGVSGEPGLATAQIGQWGLERIVAVTTAAIRQAIARP